MSLLGSELSEVYGNSFVEEISQTRKSKKQREKRNQKNIPMKIQLVMLF